MKRRVNTKFLVILTTVVVGLGVSVVVAKKFLGERPEKYISAAEEFMKQGNYEKAAQNYATAFGAGHKQDLSLLMKQAEAWRKLAETDPPYASNMLACWSSALEIDQKYVPALKKMLEFWDEQAKVATPEQRTSVYARERDYAERLAKADPSDKAAAAKVPTTIVQGWLSGTATDPKARDGAIASLVAIRPQDPSNAEIPTVLAQAYLKKSQQAAQRLDKAGAKESLRKAGEVFDAALKGQDDNVEMHARAAAVYSILAHVGDDDAARKKYADQLKAEIDRVRALAKPSDDAHVDELLTVATIMAQNGDVEGSEAVMAEVAKAQPDNQLVRLAYAKTLSATPEGRDKAIKILSAPVAQKGPAARARMVEAQTLFQLASLQLDQYSDLKDPAEKAAALQKVEAHLAKLKEVGGESTGYLRLRGQVQLLNGHQTDAIQTLVKAQRMLQQQGATDEHLTYVLANAYLQTRQTGQAKTLLSDIVSKHPTFTTARRALAQLFLSENDADNAEAQVAALEKALPKDPDVIRMRMAIHMLRKQPDQARKLYDGLPEDDARNKLGKAQVAIAVENYDDAIRLLEELRKQDPKNGAVVRLLVAAHRGRKDMASARSVLDEAIAADPADLSLVALRKQLSGATGEEMVEFTREMVEKNPDPYVRELQLAALATQEAKGDEALAHLKKAEQIKPDDPRVQEALFQAYARDAKWDLASQYVDKLAKANADRADGALFRFRLQMAQGKYADALATAQGLSAKMPEFAQTWVTLAQAQQANGHPDAAVQAYLRALEKKSDEADAMRGLIDCYYLQDKPDDALRYINLARRTFPSSPYFKELELRHALRFGDPDQAVAKWEEARKQKPEERANWANLSQAYWRAMSVHRSQNDAAGAKKYGDALHALADEAIKKWPDEQMFYAFLANLASARGDMQAGVDALKQLAARPMWKDKPEPSILLADYYAHFGKLTEAQASAHEALAKAMGGDDRPARQKLAQIQAMAGKVDDAIRTLDARPDDPVLSHQKLQLLMAAHRLDSAEKLANAILLRDPKSVDTVNALVSIYLEGGQYDKAMEKVSEVLAADPGNLAALYGRGLVYLRRPKPDLDKAIADLRAVRDKDGRNNVEARYWLAEAYVAKGTYDAAVNEMEAAVRAAPGNKQLRLRMVQICTAMNPPRWADVERVLRDGRELPGMAADPDLAVAETRMWIARRQADKAVEVSHQALAATKGNPEVIRAYTDALLASGNYRRLLDETEQMAAKPEAAPWWVFQSRGIAKRRLDKKDEALAEFERALNTKAAQSNDGLAAAVLNTMADELGVDEALSRVAQKAATNPRWQLVQAYLYQQKHDVPNAIATVEKLMGEADKLPPDQRVAMLRFAGTLYLSASPAQPEKALEAFKRSLKEYPDDTAVLNNVASLLTDYMDPPRPQEALQYSQRAYDLMMKSGRVEPLVLDTQGRVLTMVNRTAEGIVLLQDAADRTSIPDVHYHLAEAYMKQNAPEEAQKHLAQAAAAIEKAKKEHQPVDERMAKRVEELTAAAKKMVASKAQAGAQ